MTSLQEWVAANPTVQTWFDKKAKKATNTASTYASYFEGIVLGGPKPTLAQVVGL